MARENAWTAIRVIAHLLRRQPQTDPRVGITRTQINSLLKLVPRGSIVPEFAIDQRQIVVSLSAKLGTGSYLQYLQVLLDGLRPILMLLLVEADVEMADWVFRVDGRGRPESAVSPRPAFRPPSGRRQDCPQRPSCSWLPARRASIG